jgi:hypothetical protein
MPAPSWPKQTFESIQCSPCLSNFAGFCLMECVRTKKNGAPPSRRRCSSDRREHESPAHHGDRGPVFWWYCCSREAGIACVVCDRPAAEYRYRQGSWKLVARHLTGTDAFGCFMDTGLAKRLWVGETWGRRAAAVSSGFSDGRPRRNASAQTHCRSSVHLLGALASVKSTD